MAYGQTVSGSITAVGSFNAYTFSGTSGERFFLRVVSSVSSLNPNLKVYRPDGTFLCGDNGTGTDANLNPCTLSATGTHTILIGDYTGGLDTGAYTFHFQRTNDPVGASAVAYGQMVSGSITTAGSFNAYTFSGTSGDNLTVTPSPQRVP